VEKRYSDYDTIAWVYNKYWGSKFLPAALAALEKLALCRLPASPEILDLCGGTGQLARALNERGFRVTGLDGSKEMLALARGNAPAVNFILDDARTFKLPADYHLVVSAFDSLNHVLELAELNRVFDSVNAVLKNGGLFLFDLNMEAGFESNWDGFFNIVEKDLVCATSNSYNREERLALFEATIFRLTDRWRRSDVTLPERCYSEPEIRAALESAGFVEIRAFSFDGDVFKNLTADSERAFFLCCKP
jgi:SAM-dependent methyltransferase